MQNTESDNYTLPEVSLDSFVSRGSRIPFIDIVNAHNDVQRYRDGDFFAGDSEVSLLEESALRAISESARECINYDSEARPWSSSETGSCYTYAWVIAEAAKSIGMRSLIAYCNDHAFNLVIGANQTPHVVNGESRKMWLFGADKHRATQTEFRPAVVQGILEEVDDQGYSYVGLNTEGMKYHYEQQHRVDGRSSNYLAPLWLDAPRPAAAFMDIDLGQFGLYNYDKYTEALRNSDISQTEHYLGALAIVNPQAETRPKINTYLTTFGRRLRQWDEAGHDSERLVELIDSIKAVMPETVGMETLAADWLRGLGKRRKSSKIIEIAAKHYERAQAVSLSPENPTLSGKQKKTQELLARLSLVGV